MNNSLFTGFVLLVFKKLATHNNIIAMGNACDIMLCVLNKKLKLNACDNGIPKKKLSLPKTSVDIVVRSLAATAPIFNDNKKRM